MPIIAAFLLEYPFYLVAGFPKVRERLRGRFFLPFLLISALLPYLVVYLPLGQFQWIGVLRLAAVPLVMGCWYLLLPATILTDLAFLALIAAVMLGKYFNGIYALPYPGLRIEILGQASLIVISVLALTLQRKTPETGFGFVPNRPEWRIGILHYLAFLPLAALIALPLKAVELGPIAPLWRIAVTFLGFLFVVGLFEEFIFRGVLQQWLEQWTSNRTAALLLTSAIFGLAHLWFRQFPNWRWALIATMLGLFCGHARNQAGSIRAGVVTHALVVATWRAFFV